MCASNEKIRQIMIGAYRAGYANRDTSHWFAVDLHNRSHYTKEPWKKGKLLSLKLDLCRGCCYEELKSLRATSIIRISMPG